MTMKCEWCDKTTVNRSGMSSHIKTSHPEKFVEWRKGSILSSNDKKKFKEQLAQLVEPAPPSAALEIEQGKEHKRQYQKSWYWRNKKKALARQRQLDDARRKRWANNDKPAPALTPDNMNVVICPRCKCRFATMIIEEGTVV